MRHTLLFTALLTVGSACARRDASSSSQPATTERPPAAPPSVGAKPGSSNPNTAAPPERARALAERRRELDHLIESGVEREGVRDERVLSALRRVPRHRFVPESARPEAYANRPLPIGWGQTISQPYIVALMTEAAQPKSSDRCLEIGTGSGYQAAVLAELCGRTYSIEYLAPLAAFARENLTSLGYAVELRTGDGYRGWPEAAPFDVIVVTAAPERVPEPLLEQLAVGGRLVIPVGAEGAVQELELWKRQAPGRAEGALVRQRLASVRFVPFVGEAERR